MSALPRLLWRSTDGQTFTATVPIPVWRADDETKRWVDTGETRSCELVIWWDVVDRVADVGWRGEAPWRRPSLVAAKRTARARAIDAQRPPMPRLSWMPSADRVPGCDVHITFAEGRATP